MSKKRTNWVARRNTLAAKVAARHAEEPAEAAVREERARRVRAVLAALPTEQAEVLTKCDSKGQPLRTPVDVCRKCKKARQAFQKLWKSGLSA